MKKEMTAALNQYLANVAVLYVKLHNLHWNVVGRDFKPVHEYLETLYDGFAGTLDSVAECLKMNGEFPLASMKAYMETATIQELDSAVIRSVEALDVVKQDMGAMKAQAETIRAQADSEGLYGLVAMMEEQLEHYQKTLWFLEAMTQ
ncbi:DNA starvation/stationary phase protection protein [Lachnoclostridium sp. An14]|uniref:Dps family protein n=1 Tax=Lachnoclostridium sp. An14 TaxID=1965562 RepID=UPI000B36C583|nr:DNA starvation/stationary phase protection protein [Lachnoclostridium sp. An14]OUQ20599.1 DNA starvation/stationary phase protection protein [Lachnoclostridium sp. An14]